MSGIVIVQELNALVNSSAFINAKFTAPTDFDNMTFYATSVASALSLSALGNPALEKLITGIVGNSYDKKDYIVHNGIQIPNIPLASEVLKRVVAPMYLRHIGVPARNDADEMLLPVWKNIPAALEDAYVATLDVPAGVAAKWDARVKQIRDGLAQRVSAAGATVFDPRQLVKNPSLVTVTRLSAMNPVVADAVFKQNKPDNVGRVIPVAPSMFTIGVNRQLGGSNNNLHAPLYPKLVMNGGAHPFAVLSGGDDNVDNMVAIVQSRIDALKAQYKAVTGEQINGQIDNEITRYLSNVKSGFEGLEKDLNNLRDASGYLAQNPLGPGLQKPATSEDLETLAKKGREVSEKSLRLSKQFGKLSDIENLLRELVDQVKPRPVA
jgi:hypothetical protein